MAINLSQAGLNIGQEPVDGATYMMKVKSAYVKETKTGKLRFNLAAIITQGESKLKTVYFPGYLFMYWEKDADPADLNTSQLELLMKGVSELADLTGVTPAEILEYDLPTEEGEKTDLIDFLVGTEFEASIEWNEYGDSGSWQVDEVIQVFPKQ